jgi:hypothetical protein
MRHISSRSYLLAVLVCAAMPLPALAHGPYPTAAGSAYGLFLLLMLVLIPALGTWHIKNKTQLMTGPAFGYTLLPTTLTLLWAIPAFPIGWLFIPDTSGGVAFVAFMVLIHIGFTYLLIGIQIDRAKRHQIESGQSRAN